MKKYLSRKFTLTVLSLGLMTYAFFVGKIPVDQYLMALGALVGAYHVANSVDPQKQ